MRYWSQLQRKLQMASVLRSRVMDSGPMRAQTQRAEANENGAWNSGSTRPPKNWESLHLTFSGFRLSNRVIHCCQSKSYRLFSEKNRNKISWIVFLKKTLKEIVFKTKRRIQLLYSHFAVILAERAEMFTELNVDKCVFCFQLARKFSSRSNIR